MIDYSRFEFIPVLGLAGSGKSDLIARRRLAGDQVLGVEEAAGVTGVCLASFFGERVVSQEELDHRLQSLLSGFSHARPVYVEWKKHEVTGYELPDAFVSAVRRAPALYVDTPLEARIDQLLHTYAAWTERLDVFFVRIAGARIDQALYDRLVRAANVSVRQFVTVLVVDFLDPQYHEEIARFRIAWRESTDSFRELPEGTTVAPWMARPAVAHE